jgi:hypothetical protein
MFSREGNIFPPCPLATPRPWGVRLAIRAGEHDTHRDPVLVLVDPIEVTDLSVCVLGRVT